MSPEPPTVDITQALTLIAASGRTPSISGQGRDGGAVVGELFNAVLLEEVEAHDNHADGDGGIVALWSGSLTIEDSDLHDNVAGERGGAVYAWDALTFDGSTLTDNAATDGGAVAARPGCPPFNTRP